MIKFSMAFGFALLGGWIIAKYLGHLATAVAQ